MIALNWGIWTGVGMAAEALADRTGERPVPLAMVPMARRRCWMRRTFDGGGQPDVHRQFTRWTAGCWTAIARPKVRR